MDKARMESDADGVFKFVETRRKVVQAELFDGPAPDWPKPPARAPTVEKSCRPWISTVHFRR